MTIEDMIQDLQSNMRLGVDQNTINRNRTDIKQVRERLNAKLKILTALDKANQAMCEHPREFVETELLNNTDGYEHCKLCGGDLW